MPNRTAHIAVAFAICSVMAVLVAGSPSDQFQSRLTSLEESTSVFAADLPLAIVRALHQGLGVPADFALHAMSLMGWGVGVLVLMAFSRTQMDAVLMLHPGAVMMVLAGAGFGAFGLVALFAAIRQAAMSRAMVDLPMMGLTMALAAATVPEFERLILPLGSVLFLTAPPVLLERQMLSYYLIVFLPALTVLALTAGFGRELLVRSVPDLSGPNLAIAAIAAPSLAWAAFAPRTRRLALALFILFAALSLSGREGLDWPVLAAAIAGASANRGRFGVWPEVMGAAATAMIAGFLGMGLTGLHSWF